jgi:hypothetical protein
MEQKEKVRYNRNDLLRTPHFAQPAALICQQMCVLEGFNAGMGVPYVTLMFLISNHSYN